MRMVVVGVLLVVAVGVAVGDDVLDLDGNYWVLLDEQEKYKVLIGYSLAVQMMYHMSIEHSPALRRYVEKAFSMENMTIGEFSRKVDGWFDENGYSYPLFYAILSVKEERKDETIQEEHL
jgi:hypothetical protein